VGCEDETRGENQRWLYLDPSWNGLFHEGYLPSAGMF
jgi:hypothetical protein